mmetsp:Transcript_59578/g.164793  ORF Transcript_59578/g.164793 Transcript_59578/m.164793 type:complete len:441 (-) Transcript_59578:41-1363(-)
MPLGGDELRPSSIHERPQRHGDEGAAPHGGGAGQEVAPSPCVEPPGRGPAGRAAEQARVHGTAVGLRHRLGQGGLPIAPWRRGEAAHVEGRAEVLHGGDRLPVAEDAEVHLGARLVVRDGELEEGDPQEEGAAPREAEDHLQVLPLPRRVHAVVLPDVHGRRREGLAVRPEEHGLEVRRRVRRVEAVNPARAVGREDVVPRRVVVGLRVAHGIVQLGDLPQGGQGLEAVAGRAHREGEGRGEVDERSRDVRLPLCVEHGIERADQGARHLHRAAHLQVRLVENVHDPEGGVVRVVLREEAFGQVVHVQRLHLGVAVEVRVSAAAGRLLVEGPVAHPWCDLQPQGVGLLQEARVAVARVVAVQPHEVGAQRLHHPQVTPALRGPHRRGLVAEEIVLRHPRRLFRPQHWCRAIADAHHHLGGGSGGGRAKSNDRKPARHVER